MADLPDEVKAAIMLEVHSQLSPLKATVDRLDKTLHSLYRNGEGGEGYLERARAEDEEWKSELRGVVGKHGDQLDKIDDFVNTYNTLQIELQNRKKRREELWKFWGPKIWQMAGAIAIAICSVTGWAYHEISPVVKVLWQDYLRAHPVVASQLKNTSSIQPEKLYAVKQKPSETAHW